MLFGALRLLPRRSEESRGIVMKAGGWVEGTEAGEEGGVVLGGD